MKYVIENLSEYKKQLEEIKRKINPLLEISAEEKELTEEEFSKIIETKKTIEEFIRTAWHRPPRIKIVSSDGTELTVI